jgi:hypothetical protein
MVIPEEPLYFAGIESILAYNRIESQQENSGSNQMINPLIQVLVCVEDLR